MDLRRISFLVDLHNDVESATWACIVLAFRTLLRKSNLLPSGLDNLHWLQRRDVIFTSWGMCITARSSKTIQYKECQLQIPVVEVPSSTLCAVSLLKDHFSMTPLALSSDPLFLVRSGGVMKPLDNPQALAKLKQWWAIAAPDIPFAFPLHRGRHQHEHDGY